MSAAPLTIVEARPAQLELRKRLVNTDDLEAALTGDGNRDAVLVLNAGIPAPDEGALLEALAAYEKTHDEASVHRLLKRTHVMVLNVKLDFPVEHVKDELTKSAGVLVVRTAKAHSNAFDIMYQSYASATGGGHFVQGSYKSVGDLVHVDVVRGAGVPKAKPAVPRAEPVVGARPAPPPSAAAELARTRRNELLAQERWLTSQQVATQARGRTVESNPYEYASRLRREHRLFGARFRGSYLYPAFQFQPETGEPHPAVADLLARLPDSSDGWVAALWLFQPTGKLGGARPADVFAHDPGAVIDAARRDFQGDDADW